jgi:hypothetical protein
MMSLHIWSLSHGIASLFARGDAGRRRLPMAPEDLLEAAVLIYLQGLGLHAGKALRRGFSSYCSLPLSLAYEADEIGGWPADACRPQAARGAPNGTILLAASWPMSARPR